MVRLSLVTALLALVLMPANAWGQATSAQPPVFGVDYAFERVVTPYNVNDKHDRGTINLVTYIYRPLKKTNGEVVVFPHGSLGGQAISPGEPFIPPRPTIGFLMARGYTFVAPYRRGFNESGGTLIEECAYQAGKCTLEENRAAVTDSADDALAQTAHVVDHIVMRKLQPKDGKIILWGGSRGAYLALMYAAAHPKQVRGVIAVSPGTLSISEKWPAPENAIRLADQKSKFEAAGAAFRGPTLWIYAARDPFYDGNVIGHAFHDAFTKGGGNGEFIYLDKHDLPSGHVPPIDLWADEADRFLATLG
jgi:pimeloyl-ACP methyl ester carboxylesterase